MPSLTRTPLAVVILVATIAVFPTGARALDQLLAHKVMIAKYSSGVGKSFRMVARAGKQGNAPTFALPADPGATTNLLLVRRDGGELLDPLTSGVWTGLGRPAGSKGWRYTHPGAPTGGAVRLLVITTKTVRIVTRGTGAMPAPVAPNGRIDVVLDLGTGRFCAEAEAPHLTETDGKLIRSKQEPAPPGCATSCGRASDVDGDRIDDCFETNTGVFVDAEDTGTDPANPDTDDDGLADGDEVLGTLAGLDLPAFGVSPLRKDILVEYDWFDDALGCGAHSHEPSDASLDRVTTMFAAAPVVNADGSTGIHFVHDKGQGSPRIGGNVIADADGVLTGGVNQAEFKSHKAANFAPNREDYFHYAILPHRYNTNSSSSGQAEVFGDDLIVSLYCAFSVSNVAHTIAHEIGHNFGLWHGGGDSLCNYKPNYNSVMNYRYQFPGVDSNCTPPGNGVLNYSTGDRISLDENALDENEGTCGGAAWDWNGNSTIEGSVAFDLNSSDSQQTFTCGGTLSVLHDFDDWSYLRLDLVADADGEGRRAPPEVIDCDNPAPPGPLP